MLVITTVHDLASGLDKRQQIDAILLDFSKAFDKVAHRRLATKLHHYGIRNKTLAWIQSFLAERYQKVVLDGKTSPSSPFTSGVPQGTVLGPLLFLIYINDLPSRVSSTARLFADDCLLYRVISNQKDAASLQEDLNHLQEWERDWQMNFNPDKCEHIRITNKRKIIQTSYKIHGQVLKETTKAKYLGVTIDKTLSWNSHIDMVTKRANQTISFLQRNLSSCPKDIKEASYKTLVRPQLEYKYLCAFRKGQGCQTVLLRLLEDWRAALDNNEYVAAVLMDLSKAFDCLPHKILLSKLSAYGLSDEAVLLLKSYLSDRKQRIKLNNIVSSWSEIKKGVPQGSILGPLLFNVFINDIFYFIEHGTLYNYADDNTISFSSPDFNRLIQVLQKESSTLINWFRINCMQANPEKFQAIGVGKRTHDMNLTIKVSDTQINCEDVVKLLGVDIDYQLNFDHHISNLCRKAGQQLNVLKRLSPFLSRLNKLTIFHTFILSNFNYCPLAWHFCSESNSKKLEKIQERALRFVYDDFKSTYEELLNRANIPCLHIKRIRTMAVETFRILNDMSPPVLSDLVRIRDCSSYNFRYQNVLQVPQVRTTKYGKKSFRFAAAVLWNSFPDNFRQVSSFNQFKALISNWSGKDCKCNLCG